MLNLASPRCKTLIAVTEVLSTVGKITNKCATVRSFMSSHDTDTDSKMLNQVLRLSLFGIVQTFASRNGYRPDQPSVSLRFQTCGS